MPLFCPRSEIYEAMQFYGITHHEDGQYDVSFELGAVDRLPKWLRGAMIDGDLYVVSGAGYLSMNDDEDEVHIHPGDWLIYNEDRGMFFVSGNELLEDFEPIPTPERQDATVQVTGVEATALTLTFEGTPV